MAENKSKIKVLDNEYFHRKQRQSKQHTLQLKFERRHKRIRFWGSIICGLIICYGIVRVVQARLQIREIRQETVVAKRQLKKDQTKNTELQQQIEQLKDSDYLQKLIRAKYFYSKNGETIYLLPDDANN
ncbi:septum formation initiator family protein [Ligilactobacillus sp. WILCCON 0076]|uniref:Septum formation initiator family protein n=1 Tax=Ligilactobacillus ubinensis TaxID=2876789 RepID=A0A9X2JLA7_9LACO|nr:septum formation initiator family protein [Ligilactobacillus ubinensis]MCP0886827.1 septum formation initiator family protein [Ligilactobacillus ubinensis]